MQRLFYILLFLLINNIDLLASNGTYNYESITFTNAEVIDQNTTRIPFKLVDHLIVVEAELYNKKGSFIIDTGAETLILNKVHFPLKYKNFAATRNTFGVNSSLDNLYVKYVEGFQINEFNLENSKSDVIDLSHIEKSKKIHLLGVIGYSILKNYEVFIDLYLNQITLTKVDRLGNKLNNKVYLEQITDSINFKLKNHTITINGTINNQNVKFGLDSAAEFNQINKNVKRRALKYFIPKKRLTLMGASKRKIEVLAGKLHRVKLSESIYFGPMDTVLTNLSKLNEAFGTDLDAILGYDFFRQKRTIINYQKEKLYFINYPIEVF